MRAAAALFEHQGKIKKKSLRRNRSDLRQPKEIEKNNAV
jgi:hypothetical protein